ncbi:hypothetical protein SASPL_141193 [Salvia splendens]|uniref:Peptidase M48 domain-containing protein n=1 Tax=Salvia splendens TaxID=180675 RepID=A0A8X8WRC9_SALSN|nr:hypothetical protein SASPL_141193 [Salvia splendens]
MLFVATIPIPPHPESPLHESTSLSSRSAPRILSLRHSLAQNQRKSPLLDGAKRFYLLDRNKVHHFKPRGYKRWSQNPRILFSMILVGSGVVITVYFGNLETVPYTKRTHFVLLWSSLEKQLGELHKIAQDIVEAVQKGLRKEQVWTDIGYSSESLEPPQNARKPEEAVGEFEEKWIAEDKWRKENEILDDGWVQQSRKKGQEVGAKKIVVFTGLLNHFRADAEIATIIGHEVAHVVARHAAENISKNVWLTILQLILYQFFMPDVVNTMSNLFLRLPFSRRPIAGLMCSNRLLYVWCHRAKLLWSYWLQGGHGAVLDRDSAVGFDEADHGGGGRVRAGDAVEAAGEHYAVEIGAAAVEVLSHRTAIRRSGPRRSAGEHYAIYRSVLSDLILLSLMCLGNAGLGAGFGSGLRPGTVFAKHKNSNAKSKKQKSLLRRGCCCVCNCPECREITHSIDAMSKHWKTAHCYNGSSFCFVCDFIGPACKAIDIGITAHKAKAAAIVAVSSLPVFTHGIDRMSNLSAFRAVANAITLSPRHQFYPPTCKIDRNYRVIKPKIDSNCMPLKQVRKQD